MSAVTGPSGGRRAGLAAAAFALGLVLSGCTGPSTGPTSNPSSAGSPSASPSPAENPEVTTARTGALTAYANYRRVYTEASAKADYNAKLDPYVADPLLAQVKQDLLLKWQQGLITTGAPVSHPTASKVDVSKRPFLVTIEDCFDATNWITVHKDTGKSAAIPGQATKYLVTAGAVLSDDGQWRIQQSQAHRDQPC